MSKVESNFPTYQQFLEYRAVIVQAIAVSWHDDAFREKLVDDPQKALAERFDYRYPFNLALKAQLDTSEWTPATNGGWTTLENNVLEVVLPPAPADPAQHAIALAAYNAKHISVIEDAKQ